MSLINLEKVVVTAWGGNPMFPKDMKTSKVTVKMQRKLLERSGSIYSQFVKKFPDSCYVNIHGNGPQAGNAFQAGELVNKEELGYAWPLDSVVALNQGEIGHLMYMEFMKQFKEQGIKKGVVEMQTHVLVEEDGRLNDPLLFKKFIGDRFNLEELKDKDKGWKYLDDVDGKPVYRFHLDGKEKIFKLEQNGLYRRVVACPKALEYLEIRPILNVMIGGDIPIIGGGGGIPVILTGGGIESYEGVIDKDDSAACFIEQLHQKSKGKIKHFYFFLLTGADAVYENYHISEKKKRIPIIKLSEAKEMVKDKEQFPDGNIGPKIGGVIRAMENIGKDVEIFAYITNVDNMFRAYSATPDKEATAGTLFYRD